MQCTVQCNLIAGMVLCIRNYFNIKSRFDRTVSDDEGFNNKARIIRELDNFKNQSNDAKLCLKLKEELEKIKKELKKVKKGGIELGTTITTSGVKLSKAVDASRSYRAVRVAGYKNEDRCSRCEELDHEEVCGDNGKTYRTLCHAVNCAGLALKDITSGSCAMKVVHIQL